MAESVYYRFATEGLPEDTFTVVRFTGEEAISELYRFRINLLSSDDDLDIDYLQDQPSTFVIGAGGHERTIQGIITDVEIIDQPNGATVYRVELRPRAWELSRGSCHKVYLDTRTPDIIKQVLDQAGITETDYQLDMEEGEYREWEFRLQYGESYWNFLSRVLERDGIYYYFTAGDDVEKIHFCDSTRHQPSIANPDLHFSTGLGMESPAVGETVHSLVTRRTSLLRSITLQNYNDAKPSTRINVTVDVDKDGAGAAHLYGQKVQDEAEAKALAELRAEEMRAGKIVHHGESTVCLLSPAHRFGLDSHPRTSMNEQEYQVISVEHSGYDPWAARQIGEEPEAGTPAYDNRFTAIAANTQYRHPQKTEKPTIDGTLNARVDAAGDGEYAELDEEGRYHIIFPFDTEHESGKASHWVRMMQPYAGEREGMHFPLRKGARVLISFLVGDPDLPVINGAITNTEQPSVTTADNQTCGRIGTPGGNVIETDDNRGRERICFYSPNGRTRFRIGANTNLSGSGGSAGAAASASNVPDPDADGEDNETDYMSRNAIFGGTNRVTAADGWAVSATLWSDSRIRRDGEIPIDDGGIEDLKDYTDADEWRIKHGPMRAFQFPRKHEMPADVDAAAHDEQDAQHFLTIHEEAQGRLLIDRTIGDRYQFRSGSDFSFFGVDQEAFEFGPKASYSAANHHESPLDLRKIVTDTIPDFSDDQSTYETEFKELEKLRAKRDEKKREYENVLHRLNAVEDEGRGNAATVGNDAHELVFTDIDQLEEWHQLRNFPFERQNWNLTLLGGAGIPVGYAIASIDAIQEDDPSRDGSVRKAQDELEEAEGKYRDQRNTYREVGDKEWPARMRRGRISVKKFDEFLWHEGNIYDFGGCWNYNLGNGYEENHVDQQASLNPSKDLDLLKTGGPDWIEDSSPWSGKVDGVIKNALDSNNEMLVSKTFGDEYSYHNGAALDVQVGPSLSVKKGGPNVEKKYSGEGNVLAEHVKSAAGVKETWRNHKDSGAPLFYERETWGVQGHGAGKNTFTTEFSPSISLAIKCDMAQTNEFTLAFAFKTSINVGASVEIDARLGAKTAINLSAAMDLEVNLFKAAKAEFKIGSGGIMEVASYGGVKIEIDVPSTNVKVSMPGAEAEGKVDGMSVRTAAGFIGFKTVEIEGSSVKIGNKALELK